MFEPDSSHTLKSGGCGPRPRPVSLGWCITEDAGTRAPEELAFRSFNPEGSQLLRIGKFELKR